MKKTIIILFFAIIFVQNMFAWGKACRDVAKQPSETPTFYLGDVATFAWGTASPYASVVKIGVGILASKPAAYTNLTWNTPTGYTYTYNNTDYQGKMYDYTVTSVGTGYYSIWLGWGADVGTNGSFFNGKNTTLTSGDNNNSASNSNVPWDPTYCYGTFTVSAINNPTVTTPFTTTSSSVSLEWTKNTQSHNVMIVRKLSSATWTEPTQGKAYATEELIGSGTVIYNSNGTGYSNTGLLSSTDYDYKFYSVNNNYYSSGVVASTKTAATDYFRSKTTGNWNSTDTWEYSSNNTNWVQSTLVPSSSSTTVTILNGHNVSIDENVTVNSLILNSGSTLTINAGKQLTVNSTLSNSGTLNLLSSVDGTATLLTNGTVNGSGTTNVQQWLTVARQWWYLSSPLTAATSNVFAPTGSTNKIGEHFENYIEVPTDNVSTTAPYYSAPFAAGSSTPLLAGKGYVVKLTDATDGAYTFTGGTLNNGDITLTPTRTGITAPKRGFNLVGNPYPSYLDWAAAYADATNPAVNMRNAIWYRTYAGGAMTFHTYGDGDAVPETTSPLIAPMQGFWVKVAADGSNGSLTFKNTHRKHFETGANPLKVKALDARPRLRLVVSNGTATDEMLVVGKSYASDVLDSYDIEKMSNDNVAIPEVYSVVSNQELVINSMNALTEGKTVTLGFRPGQTGTNFTIEATQLENIDAKVMLLDKVAGTEQELTAGTPYSFTVSDATPTTDRFVISFAAKVPTGIETGSASGDMTVYTNRNNRIQVIYRGELNDQTTVSVYNVAGQMLSTQKLVKASTELSGTYRPGVYMIQLTDNGKKMTQKLIIK